MDCRPHIVEVIRACCGSSDMRARILYVNLSRACFQFVSLDEAHIAPLLRSKAVERKDMRPLTDAVMKMKRSL